MIWGCNEALSHALDVVGRPTTGQKCVTRRALSREVLSFRLARAQTLPRVSPSRALHVSKYRPLAATGGSVAATNEGTPHARSNPAQWLPLGKAVPTRYFVREGAPNALENPLISTSSAKNFAAARLVVAALLLPGVRADDSTPTIAWRARGCEGPRGRHLDRLRAVAPCLAPGNVRQRAYGSPIGRAVPSSPWQQHRQSVW